MFHEVRFPSTLSFGSVGGPERRTEIVTLANGFEERNTPWAHSRRRYDAGVAMRSLDDLEEVLAFFEARQGQLHGFRWKDWADYRTALSGRDVEFEDQVLGTGDGVTVIYQLTKTYRSGEFTYVRPIQKPVQGSVKIGIAEALQREGQDYEIDYTSGLITFERAPDLQAEITAGYEFDVPVRFDTASIQASVSSFRAGQVPSVPVVEIRI